MGGLGGPGAMKATVLAVALLATTGSWNDDNILLSCEKKHVVMFMYQ